MILFWVFIAFLSFNKNFNFEAREEYPVITIISTIHKVKEIIKNCKNIDRLGFINWGINATKKTVALIFVRLTKVEFKKPF